MPLEVQLLSSAFSCLLPNPILKSVFLLFNELKPFFPISNHESLIFAPGHRVHAPGPQIYSNNMAIRDEPPLSMSEDKSYNFLLGFSSP